MPKGTFPDSCCHRHSCPCGHPLLTVTPQETHHWQVVLVQFPVESPLLSSESWCNQGLVCAFQAWSLCFPHFCGSLVIKSCWASRSDSLWIPNPSVRSPGWEAPKFQCPPVDGCSIAGCDFGALTGGDECTSFYSTTLNQKSNPAEHRT